jgi:hypothetical protein
MQAPKDNAASLRLRVIVTADPGALVRVLQLFQIRNIVPRQVSALRLGAEFLQAEIEIDPAELAPETLRLIAAKIQEMPIAMAAVAC